VAKRSISQFLNIFLGPMKVSVNNVTSLADLSVFGERERMRELIKMKYVNFMTSLCITAIYIK
jgi:hypothetical protein